MAKAASKKSGSATAGPASKPKPSDTQLRKPPAPYSTPSPALRPFLERLDSAHIYIAHVDDHPWPFKRRIFSVPVLMNVVIVLLLLWRAQTALPTYVALILATLGLESSARVEVDKTNWGSLFSIATSRAVMFLMDWSLAKFIVPWPMDFFLGSPASPVSWRRAVGFQDQEIIVRRSRKWDKELPKDWLAENSDGTVYQERIMPAIDREWVKAKTGYLMMNKSWDLDFAAMTLAHELMSQKSVNLSDFQKTVIVYSSDHGWLIWPVWKLDEGSHEENRNKIVLFKDRLTAMGKENLFFRWIEVIQYESSQPGGFTAERQEEAMRKARDLFEAQGVDFDQFWKDVGGVQGLPEMESRS